ANIGAFGVVGVLGLAFAASGVMGAIRYGLNTAWDAEDRRPPVQGKLVDILLVLAVGLAAALSLALTVLTRLVRSVGDELEGPLGTVGSALAELLLGLGQLTPFALSLAVFAFLYRFVPAVETRWRDLWPGVLVAGAGYEAAKTGFSFYLENFGDYGAVYGSISAAVAFLFFVFLAANIFLLGAEVASQWPRVRSGHYDRLEALEEDRPLGEQVRDLLRRLFLGEREGTGEDRKGGEGGSRPDR
ncbi:MAG: YihY/virulence factor BrkB family protein, partial [Actinomycetota bacterium]|nr:YihY/virulence factor BrkB family protein [Actinomycetota bacterium]